MIVEYSGWISVGLLAAALVAYLLTVLSLDKKSIRREFYRALAALLILVGASLLTIAVQSSTGDTALLAELLRWSPLAAVLLTALSLPALVKAWTTTGRNPRKRPNYEPIVAFKTIGDELRAMRTIIRYERETVKGSKSALANLKRLKHVRQFFISRDPNSVIVIRADIAKDNIALIKAMRTLKL